MDVQLVATGYARSIDVHHNLRHVTVLSEGCGSGDTGFAPIHQVDGEGSGCIGTGFFGLFSIMEKFASFIGPLFFAAAVALFDSSRPGVLSLVLFFIVGGYLLTRVNVEEGRAIARAEDAAALAES